MQVVVLATGFCVPVLAVLIGIGLMSTGGKTPARIDAGPAIQQSSNPVAPDPPTAPPELSAVPTQAPPVPAPDPDPELPVGTELKYDKAVDSTLVDLKIGNLANSAGDHFLSIVASHSGKDARVIDDITLRVMKSGPRWEYYEDHEVEIWCGDARTKVYSDYGSEINTKVASSRMFEESMLMRISIEQLLQILAKDQDLDLRIGSGQPLTISARDRRHLEAFARAVQSGKY